MSVWTFVMSPVVLLLLVTMVTARPDTSDTDSMADSDSSSTRGEAVHTPPGINSINSPTLSFLYKYEA